MEKLRKVKKVWVSPAVKLGLGISLRKNRRETLYKFAMKRNCGKVPCFVCGQHVELEDVSLEHIIPKSRGGTDDMKNLSISHKLCNLKKGST